MPRFIQHLLCLLYLFLRFVFSAHAEPANPLVGFWQTEDKDGVVEFYACETQRYCGRFYWLKDDSAANPSLDDKNPAPKLQSRPLCGMQFLGGFEDRGHGDYEGGWVYSPHHGDTFSAELHLQGQDTLKMRGYVLIPLFGGSQKWTRVEPPRPCDLLVKK